MDIEVLEEVEKVLAENKTLEKLTLTGGADATLPREFCNHVLLGSRQNSSLSEMHINLKPENWDCTNDGRLVCMHVS